LIKILLLISILFVLLLISNFTVIYAEKLSDVIEEIYRDRGDEIIKVELFNNGKCIIIGNKENEDGTAGSWIKIVDEEEPTIKKEFLPDKDAKRKILRCVTLDEQGNYVLGGYKQKQGEVGYKAWLLVLDKKGDRKIIGDDTYNDNCYVSEFKAITTTEDGGYIAVGWKCDDKDKFNKMDYDTWVIRLDSNFINKEKEEDGKNFIKIGVKDFATDIVRETPVNSQEVNYVIAIAIEDQREKSKTIRLIKINESLEEIVEENREEKKMEIDLKLGDGGIYYISEDNEDDLIIVGYDKDPKNKNKFLWVREFSDTGRDEELLRRSDNNVNRFVFGIEKNNEDCFTLISYPNNIEIPLQLVIEGINGKKTTLDEAKAEDNIIKEKTDKEQIDEEKFKTAEQETIGEENEEGEERPYEPEETTRFDKIKEIINNINIFYLLILLGLILIFSILYFTIKSQKKGKLNKIEYKNFSLGRMEEIELLLKRIQIELKKELYEAEQLNNFSYKQRLKEIKIKFMSVAKKYTNKDVDLLVIQNQLEALLKEIDAFIR